MASLTDIVDKLKAKNENWTSDVAEAHGEVTIILPRESIVEVCVFLKNEAGFDMLADLCGVDRGPEEDPRFEVNYHLFSTTHYQRMRLKVLLSEDNASVATVTQVWKTAEWHEREVYDLMGVYFLGNRDLRRILCPEDWEGFPLRKDYKMPTEYHGMAR